MTEESAWQTFSLVSYFYYNTFEKKKKKIIYIY